MASNAVKKKKAAGKGNRSAPKKANTSVKKTKASPAKKKTTTNTKRETTVQESLPIKEMSNPLIMRETILWLVLALCVVMYISYMGIGGYVGDVISDLSFGIFGFCAYLFPFLLFVAVAFWLSNKGNPAAGMKFGAYTLLYICSCSFAALFSDQYEYVTTVSELYADSASYKNGGGVIGGGICGFLKPALGMAGTGVVLLVLTIICLILITQKSLMKVMRRQSTRVYRSAKESTARMREAHRQEIEERKDWEAREAALHALPVRENRTESLEVFAEQDLVRREPARKGKKAQPVRRNIEVPLSFPVRERESRLDRKVAGVTSDTRITTPAPVGEMSEIHEIIPGRQYINLEQQEKDQKVKKPDPIRSESSLEIYQEKPEKESTRDNAPETEILDFHIDGIGVKKEEIKKKIHRIEPLQKTEMEESKEELNVEAPLEEAVQAELPKESPSSKRNPRSSKEEIEQGIADVQAMAEKAAEVVLPEYVFPPIDLLKKGKGKTSGSGQEQEIRETAAKLQQTLNSFGVHATVTNASCGPSVTRYELMPEQGVKVSRIVSLADDIKLNLAAADIRIEAPIPGKAAVGIEVPNAENSAVAFRDLIESDEFQNHKSKIAFATGRDIGGRTVVSDIAKMPHLLIAGATGSGKSVCINTIIMSILYKAKPEEVKLIMIDPKVVELSVYNGIPHLFIPVVTDPKKAAGALNWGVSEMMDRYNKFAEVGVRDLQGYNKKIEALKDVEDENKPQKLPQIVIIVDELADLMMVAPGEVEDAICRLAQLARAAGIHLIIATQRPSVNVITGVIKANLPSRIAFSVSSGVDSRTIIDMFGAEKLLGKGDMLFYPSGYKKPERVQGAFVSDEEVADVVDFLKENNSCGAYDAAMQAQIAQVQKVNVDTANGEDKDLLFADAGKLIIDKDKASIGMLQRYFKIGFNRAARIMDQLSDAGVVGPEEGTKPRKILMSTEQFENYLEENG